MGKETHITVCEIHVSLQHYGTQLSRNWTDVTYGQSAKANKAFLEFDQDMDFA